MKNFDYFNVSSILLEDKNIQIDVDSSTLKQIKDFLMNTKRSLEKNKLNDPSNIRGSFSALLNKLDVKKIEKLLGNEKQNVQKVQKVLSKVIHNSKLSFAASLAIVSKSKLSGEPIKKEIKIFLDRVKKELRGTQNISFAVAIVIVTTVWYLIIFPQHLSLLTVAALFIFIWWMRTASTPGTEGDDESNKVTSRSPSKSPSRSPSGDSGIL